MGMPDETVDATGLNADLEAQVRAIAEMAVSGLAQMRARPDTALDPGDEPSIDAPAAEASSSVEGVAEPQMWFIGGGGSAPAPAVVYDGPFAPTFDQTGSLDGFDNCYFQHGGRTILIGDAYGHCTMPEIGSASEGFIVVEVPTTSGSAPGSATLGFYGTLYDLNSAQNDFSKFIIPLYKVAASNNVVSIALDMRRLATVVAYEL